MTTETNTPTDKVTDEILKEFEQLEREAGQPSWLYPFRKAGIARFAELGFPTLKDEDWRFTNVAPIAKLPFHPVLDAPQTELSLNTVSAFALGALPTVLHRRSSEHRFSMPTSATTRATRSKSSLTITKRSLAGLSVSRRSIR